MDEKYSVEHPDRLKSWEKIAKLEIEKWLNDADYQNEICNTTMQNEMLGPFTKFLYYFASLCKCGWGVMVGFDEKKQRVFLPDHYYKWMHKLRDEIQSKNKYIMDENLKKLGLFPKYIIQKTNGKPISIGAKYFVMRYDNNGSDPVHVKACQKALMVYAHEIKNHLPLLSKDLLNEPEIQKIIQELDKTTPDAKMKIEK